MLEKDKIWITRTLKDYGNCYVSEKINLSILEEETGLKLKIREADCGGYIIEVVKSEKNF